MNREEWRSISEWPNYEVSNKGRVRNRKGNILKKQIHYGKDKNLPYYRVQLWNMGTRKNRRVNRLVAQTFLKNPNNHPEVDHGEGGSLDDSITNLEWVSRQENARRRAKRC